MYNIQIHFIITSEIAYVIALGKLCVIQSKVPILLSLLCLYKWLIFIVTLNIYFSFMRSILFLLQLHPGSVASMFISPGKLNPPLSIILKHLSSI